MADYDSSANYKQARAMGRHYLSEHSDSATKGYLYILDDLLDNVEICGEINLGTTEIPIHKILGTRTSARSNAFAGNFMPLLPENTEFGAKWCKLYESHIREGIREPIKVYEYLNRYFVQEGNKRVSVLKYLGAVAIEARVTRLIPKRDESNKQISIYYEFLDFDRRATFDNLWFSHRGGFTGLVNLVETWQHEHPECKTATADLINASFKAFRLCYRLQARPAARHHPGAGKELRGPVQAGLREGSRHREHRGAEIPLGKGGAVVLLPEASEIKGGFRF